MDLNYPLRNTIYEKIQQSTNLTDAELISMLSKDGVELNMVELNKILLDLEIYGLLKVSWVSKDKRRIEVLH